MHREKTSSLQPRICSKKNLLSTNHISRRVHAFLFPFPPAIHVRFPKPHMPAFHSPAGSALNPAARSEVHAASENAAGSEIGPLPTSVLYSICARIGGSGLDSDSLEA